jgi:hypothetical protein
LHTYNAYRYFYVPSPPQVEVLTIGGGGDGGGGSNTDDNFDDDDDASRLAVAQLKLSQQLLGFRLHDAHW